MSLTREDKPRMQEEEMTGTPSQIEWAEQIKPRVSAEFERVVNAFKQAADKQSEQDRMEIGRAHV